MSSGGIIIQRRGVLVPAIMDPGFFQYLRSDDQAKATAIAAKGPDGCTDEDNSWITKKLREVQHRGPGAAVTTVPNAK